MVIYKDINIKGNNIGGKQRPIYDGEECADECLKTAGCKGFTMAKYGAYRGCWIKASKEFQKLLRPLIPIFVSYTRVLSYGFYTV